MFILKLKIGLYDFLLCSVCILDCFLKFISEEKQSEMNVKTGLNIFLKRFWNVLR